MFLSHRKLRSFSLDVLHSFCNRKITIVERMGRALPAFLQGNDTENETSMRKRNGKKIVYDAGAKRLQLLCRRRLCA